METARIVAAESWSRSLNVETVRRAIALDPANPDFHYLLGKLLLLDGKPGDAASAADEFRTAITMNSYSAVYWSGLAKACYAAADQSCADQSFHRAQKLAPRSPQFAWEAAVNDVVSNQPKAALEQLKTFLRMQPDGWGQAFQLVMRGFNDPDIVWHSLLADSNNVAAKMDFLNFLTANNRFDVAASYWTQLSEADTGVPMASATPYLERLLGSGHYEEAAKVWSYLQAQDEVQPATAAGRNLVFNGGFEQSPLNAGFDWRSVDQPYMSLDFADGSAHTGTHALRADFTVPQNAEYEIAYQWVPVVPNQTYELSAYARSEGITSDSGPRLRALDPQCAACLNAATEGTTGTTDWHKTATEFTTGPNTHIVRLSIWRPQGRVYPMEIGGQVWLDDVSLYVVPSATSRERASRHGNTK
ncbi:MAG: carbohydrate binding domain-containing protein [Candidatus Korobacteraceae bacterium]